jgi:hypothetical protein
LNREAIDAKAKECFGELYSVEDMEVQQMATIYANAITSLPADTIVLAAFEPVHPDAQISLEPDASFLEEFKIDESELYTLKEDGSYEYLYFTDDSFNIKEAKKKTTRPTGPPTDSPFYLKSDRTAHREEEKKDGEKRK